jgi:hypothetical protein
MAKTSLLTEVFDTKSKCSIDPGELQLEIAYDPNDTNTYQLLATQFGIVNAVAPNWQITFPSVGEGSGDVRTETFKAHVAGLGREIKKDDFCTVKVTLAITGDAGFYHT